MTNRFSASKYAGSCPASALTQQNASLTRAYLGMADFAAEKLLIDASAILVSWIADVGDLFSIEKTVEVAKSAIEGSGWWWVGVEKN
jgi:hypothetical protein